MRHESIKKIARRPPRVTFHPKYRAQRAHSASADRLSSCTTLSAFAVQRKAAVVHARPRNFDETSTHQTAIPNRIYACISYRSCDFFDLLQHSNLQRAAMVMEESSQKRILSCRYFPTVAGSLNTPAQSSGTLGLVPLWADRMSAREATCKDEGVKKVAKQTTRWGRSQKPSPCVCVSGFLACHKCLTRPSIHAARRFVLQGMGPSLARWHQHYLRNDRYWRQTDVSSMPPSTPHTPTELDSSLKLSFCRTCHQLLLL